MSNIIGQHNMPLKVPKKKKERKANIEDLDEVLRSHEHNTESPEIDSPTKLAKALHLPDAKMVYQLYHRLVKDVGQEHIQGYTEFVKAESKALLRQTKEPRMSLKVLITHFNYLKGLYFTYKNSPAKYKVDVGLLEPWEVKYEDKEKRLQDTIALNKKAGEMLLAKNKEIQALKDEMETYRVAYRRSWTFAAYYISSHNIDTAQFREYLEGSREKEDIKGMPEYLLDMFSRSKDWELETGGG